jgi:hypothetical protein
MTPIERGEVRAKLAERTIRLVDAQAAGWHASSCGGR